MTCNFECLLQDSNDVPSLLKCSSTICDNPSSPTSASSIKPYSYKEMVCKMLIAAEEHDRDIVYDALKLIIIYFTWKTNDILQILDDWDKDEEKLGFVAMLKIYGIRSEVTWQESYITLSRIADSMPHISLMACQQMESSAQSTLSPWVTDEELGATISHHFKMNYFPALVNLKVGGLKVQVGLLLWNLCFAKVLMKTSTSRMSSVDSFQAACTFAISVMNQQLASTKSQRAFTEFVESMDINAVQMNEVWQRVIGNRKLLSCEKMCLTPFHRRVFMDQPLNLKKWKLFMEEIQI